MLIGVFLTLLCVVAIAAKTSSSVETKYNALVKLSARAKSNVINLDDSTYASFATEDKSRSYTLMVMLTASHPKFKCQVCKQVDINFMLLANAYDQKVKNENIKRDIFFIRIDYASSSKTFQNYEIQTVPLVFHLSPTHGLGGSAYEVGARERFQASQPDQDVDALSGFFTQRTGISVKIDKPMFFAYLTLFILFGVALLAVRSVIRNLEWWINFVQIKSIWVTISLGIYVCAISGLIFDIIRSPPWYQIDPRTRQAMFFYPYQGNQFIVEGFIIGFLNLMCGGSLFFLGVIAPTCSKNPQTRTMAMIISSGIFVVCFYAVRSFYRIKNQWYSA
jgi:oligosaccharyltransferase complex subunit gamma